MTDKEKLVKLKSLAKQMLDLANFKLRTKQMSEKEFENETTRLLDNLNKIEELLRKLE